MIYRDEPYPDEMDQARDFLIAQDEESAASPLATPPPPSGDAAVAADPDELLAQFAELVLHVNAARTIF